MRVRLLLVLVALLAVVCAVVGWVVDLDAADAQRLPEQQTFELNGIKLPRLALATGAPPLPAVIALITSMGAASAPHTA